MVTESVELFIEFSLTVADLRCI